MWPTRYPTPPPPPRDHTHRQSPGSGLDSWSVLAEVLTTALVRGQWPLGGGVGVRDPPQGTESAQLGLRGDCLTESETAD